MKANPWITVACSLGYLLVAFACLIGWGSPQPWLRLDYFSGGYLLLRLLSSIYSFSSSWGVFRSPPVMKQWWGLDSDPAGPRRVMVLMALDLIVFLDYGHGPLVPWLRQPVLQIVGLGLYVVVTVWQIWTDAYLANYFTEHEIPEAPMKCGPYRYVRHPRYAAAIAGKVAMALALASIVGWLLVIAWALLLLNKIAVEEKHLRELFGPGYESYARTTARVIPGIYYTQRFAAPD
jgi:protein-S-isoprenylcysteine O-methyltransferase Ste14